MDVELPVRLQVVVAPLLVSVVHCCFVRGCGTYCAVARLFLALNLLIARATEVAKFVSNCSDVPVLWLGLEFQFWSQSNKPRNKMQWQIWLILAKQTCANADLKCLGTHTLNVLNVTFARTGFSKYNCRCTVLDSMNKSKRKL